MHVIATGSYGNKGFARWGDIYFDDRNRAAALSAVLERIAKAHPEYVGDPWEAPECNMKGTVPKPKRGRK